MRERVWTTKDSYGNDVIKHRLTPQREEVGSGHEHVVHRSLHHPNYVFKLPHPHTLSLLNNILEGTGTIRNELQEAHEIIVGTSIQIPRTRIISYKDGYIIIQHYIEDDQSINIDDYFTKLLQTSSPHLTDTVKANIFLLQQRYESNPSNFASNNNNVYWLDPFKGNMRILDKTGILNAEDFIRWKLRMRKLHHRR